MGRISVPQKAMLFAGLLYHPAQNRDRVIELMGEQFGGILLTSIPFTFTETDYYSREMGEDLQREFVAFETLIDMDRIVDIKLSTNRMEELYFTRNGNRSVNIDPGYLTSAKVVLATTKDFQHRVYLGRGMYAEVTLRYRKDSFRPWEWTFKDYRREDTIQFFNRMRHLYRSGLKGIS